MNIFKSILGGINGKENLSAKRISDLVKKKSSTGLGGFVDLNNDLGLMVDDLPNHDPNILMPYFYARRGAAAGMFSQGAIDKQAFDQVDSLFFNFMAQVGSKITKDEQIKFQEDSLDRALELQSKYHVVGATRKSSTLLLSAAKQGISMRDALLNALEHDQDNLKNIVKPVMCSDWVMQPEFCMSFFATGAWQSSDDFDITSRKVLKYFESIGMPFENQGESISNLDNENQIANKISKGVNDRIGSIQIALQFVLEELDAARQGNEEAIQFVESSGFSASEYEGAIQNSFKEVDGPNGPQQFLLSQLMPYSSDMIFMVNLRLQVVRNIINEWGLTTQSEDRIDSLLHSLRHILEDDEDVMPALTSNIRTPDRARAKHIHFRQKNIDSARRLISALSEVTGDDTDTIIRNALKINEKQECITNQDEIFSKLSKLSESDSIKTCKMDIQPIKELWNWEFEFSHEELEVADELVSILYDLRNGDFVAIVSRIVKPEDSYQGDFDEPPPF